MAARQEADDLHLSKEMILREAFSSGHHGFDRLQKVEEAVDCKPQLKALLLPSRWVRVGAGSC